MRKIALTYNVDHSTIWRPKARHASKPDRDRLDERAGASNLGVSF
jgi:hypothetical protein